jgi:structural maintenance of chromosome 2
MPKLDQLKEAKRIWMEFQQVETELERTKQFVIGFQYDHFEKKTKTSDEQHHYLTEQLGNLDEIKGGLEDSLVQMDEDYTRLIDERKTVI